MQYFLTSTGRAGCYVRKDKFDQRLASARSFAPRTEEVLHPVRRAVARRLGELPAVLAPHRRQQPAQVRQRAPARLDPPEPRPEPPHQLIEGPRPPFRVGSI